MKFIKFYWKMWFFACGLSAVILVILDIKELRQGLIDTFIFLFAFNLFNSSLGWLHGKIGKIRYYFLVIGIAFVLFWIQRTVIDIIRNDSIHWIINLIVAACAMLCAGIGLAVFEFIWYLRNKKMNSKLKEYQKKLP